MKLHCCFVLMLSVFAGGCATCDEQEFLHRLARQDAIDANWKPGEFDMVDRHRAFRRQLREDILKSRDFSAGCKALDAYLEQDRIKGFH